ncbi:MAG: alpha-galactosidase [Clostridiales Family XIII bacterium]|jgi:alpha-galactosidase|nr:alpha-galactosidase [Clostridiales Family XIII bacterium]
MAIFFHKDAQTWHLTNGRISYIIKVLKHGEIGQLYFGAAVKDRDSFDYLLETRNRPMTTNISDDDTSYSAEHIKNEYPTFGRGDFKHPAFHSILEDGSHVSELVYDSYVIEAGKRGLDGQPATYVEDSSEADTLIITLKDALTGLKLELNYTIFNNFDVIARSSKLTNSGKESIHIERAMSLSLDLPSKEYDLVTFNGAWSRERFPQRQALRYGIQSVESTRGSSSATHNPFIMLLDQNADEDKGEVIGLSLIYSGNFISSVEVDQFDIARVQTGINPFTFAWVLSAGETFETPEAVLVYSANGANAMSTQLNKLYRTRLARGYWRDRVRPILVNNWEGTYFDFDEKKILDIAEAAKNVGIEMFVLDDGWFGKRDDDYAGLGDWYCNMNKLEHGIDGLAERIEDLGMKFGLWFEPEMVNKDSDLYRTHPDYMIATPNRQDSPARHQFVLDFSRTEVVDNIFKQMYKVLSESKISYIKLDMNRAITQAYSNALGADRQSEIWHRYILGVYDLYNRLNAAFPEILIESCASGGSRFDPGLLYYAPQAWTSDDTDAVERMKIQWGSSYCYPISSMGAHVSAIPNHQTFRQTPIKTRANVAMFGTFGYELDMTKLTDEEITVVKEQVAFMKEYRDVFQLGDFYRLISPFESEHKFCSWLSVTEDKETAIVGYYKILNEVNGPYHRVKLTGLNPEKLYSINGDVANAQYGDALMNIGLITSDASSGEGDRTGEHSYDFDSRLYVLKAI